MMLYPSINEDLKDKTDSRYTLIMLTAKRARDIIEGKPVITNVKAERPVSFAAHEISEGLITYKKISQE
ncbi:MAG TPA: DNA-directed RNA polymerase subunit omega [Anaerovoracaceae bacterium]|nr:DNA-directed RNA polymerase subunit omega [Anaerovoracaceae bacterium]